MKEPAMRRAGTVVVLFPFSLCIPLGIARWNRRIPSTVFCR